MGKRILYLVRHGQYTNESRPLTEPDGSLTLFGQDQARLLGERMKDLPIHFIYVSTLKRARETADFLATALPEAYLRPSDLLRECIPSVPPGFEEHFTHIPADFIARGAEQANQAYEKFFAPVQYGDQHEILVSSGNLINYMIARAVGGGIDSWVRVETMHCAITEIQIGENLTRLVRHNDVCHLPAYLQMYR